jgi:large subunit ribosomal protein L29
MKIEKWREHNREDLQRKLNELRDSLFRTRIKVQTKQVENTAQLSGLRRDIARILTVLRDMQAKGVDTPLAAQTAKPEAQPAAPAKRKSAAPKTR